MYIQVNIGRNFRSQIAAWDNTPMRWGAWSDFIEDVKNTLDRYREHSDMGDDMPQVHLGTGVWDGVPEESAHISLYHEGGFDLDGIRERLSKLKAQYGQDAIALIVRSELV